MRILVLLPSLLDSIGGIQTYSQALVYALNELGQPSGWQIHILALHDRAEADSPCLDLAGAEHRGFSGKKVAFTLASIREARNADIVILGHVHFAPLLNIFGLVSPHASFFVAAHGIEVWRPLSGFILSGLHRADQIWCVSDFTRRKMLAENPALAHLRFARLPNTLGPRRPSAQTAAPVDLPAGKVVLCVSRMSVEEPYKNVEILIRALPSARVAVPDVKLVIVGPGDDQPRLAGVVRDLGLEDAVTFTGRVSDDRLQQYFAGCDLFALPSTGEGFGIVYLEAMHYGKACIGANAGGVPEVIEDRVTGVLVDPVTPQTVSGALLRLLTDDRLRAAMGAAGHKRLEEKFSTAVFRACLRELLSSR